MTVISPETLAHYGVLGMRWGKRKSGTPTETAFYNPKSSKETVKRAKVHAKRVLEPSIDRRLQRMFGEAHTVKVSELSTKGVTIAKGKELARITLRKNEKLRDMTYVAHTPNDRKIYKAIMPSVTSFGYAKRAYKPSYEAVYKATKNLKAPSEKARFDAFVELVDASAIPVGRGGKTMTGRDYMVKIGMDREIKKLDAQRVGQKYYYDFVEGQFSNNPLNTAYFDSLRKKGYDAVADDQDRGIISDDPLIILDTKGAIKQMSVRQMTNDEINEAIATIEPLKGS